MSGTTLTGADGAVLLGADGDQFVVGLAPAFAPIGTFAVGAMAVGTPPSVAWQDTILSQFGNSPTVTGMIASFQAAAGQTGNIDLFFDTVWNIQTASGYGLDVWGRIVGGVSRVVNVPQGEYFGFAEQTLAAVKGFGQAALYSGQQLLTPSALTDAQFRTVILAKAMWNICNGSIPGINAVLRALVPGLIAYVTDGQNMTMQWVFDFLPTPVERAILYQLNVLPKPAGVSASIVVV